MIRPFALTIPAVIVCPRPKGFPIAKTQSPTSSFSESPRWTKGSVLPDLILMSAMSVLGSVPTTSALNSSLSRRFTVISSAFSTTWLFVRM